MSLDFSCSICWLNTFLFKNVKLHSHHDTLCSILGHGINSIFRTFNKTSIKLLSLTKLIIEKLDYDFCYSVIKIYILKFEHSQWSYYSGCISYFLEVVGIEIWLLPQFREASWLQGCQREYWLISQINLYVFYKLTLNFKVII